MHAPFSSLWPFIFPMRVPSSLPCVPLRLPAGALLVTKVLQDPALKQQWYQEVKVCVCAKTNIQTWLHPALLNI